MSLTWIDVSELGLEGKGWTDTAHFYDRLPARAEGIVTTNVWERSLKAAGLSTSFVTDATELHARCILRQPPAAHHLHIPWLDVYASHDEAWRWCGFSRSGWIQTGQTELMSGLPAGTREFKIYLPYQFILERLEIGVPEGSTLRALQSRPTGDAIAYYGTSIVHGFTVSRPGMLFTSILGRRLDVPVINLGFSGCARMEPPLGTILAELEPAMFAVDPLPNMNLEQVEENAEPFMRELLKRHADTPILMVEDREHANHWLYPDAQAQRRQKRAAYRAVYDKLVDEGYTNLAYKEGDDLIGLDSEATVDSSHPSDLGAWRYADALEPIIRQCLNT